MAVCRFSDDDCQCDLYVYESTDGGWVTHVEGVRYVITLPLPKPVSGHWWSWSNADLRMDEYRERKVDKILELSRLVPIGLPADGEMFVDETVEACAERIKALVAMGYRVPSDVINWVRWVLGETPDADWFETDEEAPKRRYFWNGRGRRGVRGKSRTLARSG